MTTQKKNKAAEQKGAQKEICFKNLRKKRKKKPDTSLFSLDVVVWLDVSGSLLSLPPSIEK